MMHWVLEVRRQPIYALAALLCCVEMVPGFAADAPKQEISRVIAKEFNAAQKAIQAQQWADAITNLDAAQAKSPLTTFDKKTILDDKGYVYARSNNNKAAQAAYEAAIATGGYTPEELARAERVLFRLTASTQQYAKAVEYGKQAADAGVSSTDDLGLMSQLYYLLKDCKNSGVWGDKAIAAAHKAGEVPKENVYQFKLQCAADAKDTPGELAGLYDLIRLTNKTSYWNNLIRLERSEEREDKNTLMIDRIMYDTNSMTSDSDYIELAQLLGDQALPGEAAAVLDKALGSGVVSAEHNERTGRLAAALKVRADADKKGLPQLDAEASKNPAGQLDVKTGEVYFGAGDYQGAVTAINRGLQKGQVKSLDEAYVYLGRSEVALKNFADAKKAFGQLKTVPNINPRVLKLWELYAEKLGQPYT